MAGSVAARALRYRNSAQHIRIDAPTVDNEDERQNLLRLATAFDALADYIEQTPMSSAKQKVSL